MDLLTIRSDALIIRLAKAGVSNVLHIYYEALCDGDPVVLNQLFDEPIRLTDVHDELNRRMVVAIKGESKIVLKPKPLTPLEIKQQTPVIIERKVPTERAKPKSKVWKAGEELPL